MFNLMPWRTKEPERRRALMRGDEHPLTQLRSEFDGLMQHFFGMGPMPSNAVDVDDTGNEYVVRAEVPGFEAADFQVRLTGDFLTLRAEREQGDEPHSEFRRFEHSLSLPGGIEPDQITARYHSGVLEIHVPKAANAQAKRIKVKA